MYSEAVLGRRVDDGVWGTAGEGRIVGSPHISVLNNQVWYLLSWEDEKRAVWGGEDGREWSSVWDVINLRCLIACFCCSLE